MMSLSVWRKKSQQFDLRQRCWRLEIRRSRFLTILGEFGVEITERTDAGFVCDCSKERVSRAIATLSREDLDDMINDGEEIEVKCQFCNKAYRFGMDELKEMRK